MINYVQSSIDAKNDRQLLYEIDDLRLDDTDGKRDKYTKIKIYDIENYENYDTDVYDSSLEALIADMDDADVVIEDTDDEEYDDDEDTEGKGYMFEDNLIPITYVDIYTMSANLVSFLDVNFLTEDTAGSASEIWLTIRRIVSGIILASMYVAVLILITSLILHGVKIVANSMNPRAKADDKQALNKFIIAVVMLVGSIIIMAIGIYAYQAVGIVAETPDPNDTDSDAYEFPIRVNVVITEKDWWGANIKEQYYSFSTTITGYMRFMAQIENPERYAEKAGYVITYIILANMNVIILAVMLIRMIAMWFLAVVGPIIASLYAITKDDKMVDRFKTWAYCYLILGFVQLIFAIAYWMMMETMGFN